MDPTVISLVGLLFVLMVGQYFTTEYFTTDNSGNTFTLSLSDLLALIGKSGITNYSSATTAAAAAAAAAAAKAAAEDAEDALSQRRKKRKMNEKIDRAVEKALHDKEASCGDTEMDDSCIDSFSQQQGSQFMKYIPGKNPADYIRKDSIPCYGCNIP